MNYKGSVLSDLVDVFHLSHVFRFLHVLPNYSKFSYPGWQEGATCRALLTVVFQADCERYMCPISKKSTTNTKQIGSERGSEVHTVQCPNMEFGDFPFDRQVSEVLVKDLKLRETKDPKLKNF